MAARALSAAVLAVASLLLLAPAYGSEGVVTLGGVVG
jgi:hypothetical protein